MSSKLDRCCACGFLLFAITGCESKRAVMKAAAAKTAAQAAQVAAHTASEQRGIRILAWNIESGGSTTSKILEQLDSHRTKGICIPRFAL